MKFRLKSGYGRSDVGSIVLDPEAAPEYETWDADEIVNLRAMHFVDEVEVPAKDVIASLVHLELRHLKNVRSFDARASVIAATEHELAARHDELVAAEAESEPESLARERAELEARLEEIADREALLYEAAASDGGDA